MYLKNLVQLATSPSLFCLPEPKLSREEVMKHRLNSPFFSTRVPLLCTPCVSWLCIYFLWNCVSGHKPGVQRTLVAFPSEVALYMLSEDIFISLGSSHRPLLLPSAPLRPSPTLWRVALTTPCAPFGLNYDHWGVLTSDLSLVCSLTFQKSVDLPRPPGNWNSLQKENSELRIVEYRSQKKKNQQLKELIMPVFLHPFCWWKSLQNHYLSIRSCR